MKSKTIKTIVFAALIAAMVIPFAGMQSVYAVHESEEEHGANETPVEVIRQGASDREVIPQGSSDRVPIRDDSYGPDNSHLPEGTVLEGENFPEGYVPDQTHGPDVEVIRDPPEIIPMGDRTHLPEGTVPDGSYEPEGEVLRENPITEPPFGPGVEIIQDPDGSNRPATNPALESGQ